MIRHRPAQRSLEAFVAAARFLSFTRAASELHVTVPAVSRRIQAIETDFGVQLFHRRPRALSLTPVGKRYFDELAPALLAVEEAHDVLRRALLSTVVTVSVPTLFGANWLLPRLKDFVADHGDSHIDLKASADDGAIDWRDMDLAIRSSRGTWPEAEIEELLPVTAYPVCSPSLLRDRCPLLSAESLLALPLLALAGRHDSWPAWFKRMGTPRPKAVVAFDDPHLLYEAAASGLGVALGEDVLLDPYLDGDRLMPAPGLAVALGDSYILCRPRRALDPAVGRFRDWLVTAAAQWSKARSALAAHTAASR